MENKLIDWDGSSIDCITEHGGFQSVCLDVWVLQTALYQTRQEPGRSSTSGPVHKLAYSPRLFNGCHILNTSEFNLQNPSVHSISAVGKVVLGISWA